ncbi:hypothetical protein [Cohnella panacarvi]|uniref:hypothetical protein n=1 Tax=Cohnella panacarvi TaxID=400776 RepID=UPI00047D5D47|nr:hypothetical protein [Cohnella panacarvi]
MDYNAVFGDVLAWIGQANHAATMHGMDSDEFWKWAADSAGNLCRKYDDNRLVIKQMTMMVEWLEEVFESRKKAV